MDTEPASRRKTILYASSFLLLGIYPLSGILLAILLVLLLLSSSAMISGSEVAYFSLTHHDFAKLKEENTPSANRILQLHERPRTLLATILISNNFINIAIVLVSDFVLSTLMPQTLFENWATSITNTFPFIDAPIEYISRNISFAINVVGVTFLLVLFGEIAPKVYATLNNIRLAKVMSRPLLILMGAFRPVSSLLVRGTNVIERRLERRTISTGKTSRADIDEAIELTVKHEQNARQEIDILKGIVKFGDLSVRQIMHARVDVKAVEINTSFSDLVALIKEWGFSRIPVYQEDFDHIVGILYAKDLLGFLDQDKDFKWQSLIRTQLLFVPEAKKINDMLREFQSERMHLAFVVDEYGGTLGIVTLEDIMEEVIGEIRDEFDDEEEVEYEKIDDFNYEFEGKTLLNDCCRVLNISTDTFDPIRGDADSLAGLVLYLAGQFPKKGTEYAWDNYRFKVLEINKRRIIRILVTLLEL